MTANPDGIWPGFGYCEGGDGQCSDYWPNCGPYAQDYDCATYKDLVTECDEVLGAGLTFNVGGSAANKLCDLHGGQRYIVGDDPDMAGAFECIAKVGASGPDAPLGDAMIAALSPELNGRGLQRGLSARGRAARRRADHGQRWTAESASSTWRRRSTTRSSRPRRIRAPW
jgi:hypothetical protein